MVSNTKEPVFSLLENAPAPVIYIPIGLYLSYLMLRYRGTMLASAANTNMVAGGLMFESKTDLFNLLGPKGRAHFAPFVTVEAGKDTALEIEQRFHGAGLEYPVVIKPDIGRNGRGVKIIHDREMLAEHVASFPSGAKLLAQRYITDEYEAGVFYVRDPDEGHGHITSLTLKFFPTVVGDGTSTVRELILRDQRARVIKDLYFKRNHKHLDRILARGERHRIVSVGNHVRGSLFEDGAEHITAEMTAAFDAIAKEMPGFYFGRFDVKYRDLKELKAGRGFTIIEYNGASSEPTHVWDRRTSPFEVYRQMFKHWHHAFRIGAKNRARGAHTLGVVEVVRRYYDELAYIQNYPDEE